MNIMILSIEIETIFICVCILLAPTGALYFIVFYIVTWQLFNFSLGLLILSMILSMTSWEHLWHILRTSSLSLCFLSSSFSISFLSSFGFFLSKHSFGVSLVIFYGEERN